MQHYKKTEGLSKILIISLFGVIGLILGGIVFIIIGSQVDPTPPSVKLTVWGVWDDTSDLQTLFSGYQKSHPYISISYRKLRYDEYEDALLNAWATDSGPDIYAIPASWITKYRNDFITPLPKKTTVAYYSTKKVLFSEETQITSVTETSLTASDIKRNFIDVINGDIVYNGKIYGIPLGINTLVMYYNRELLNQAALVEPPKTWNDFVSTVLRLAIADEQGNVIRAATALGTDENIPHAADIVTLLMMQYDTEMIRDNKVYFHRARTEGGYLPGVEALRFYTDFASPEKTTYTWNSEMPNALDYFAEGELAFFFGYPYDEPEIIKKNRGVDYAIAPVPQPTESTSTNYGNYWVYTVSKKSKRANEAWNFLQSSILNSKRIKSYLALTKQSSVLRSVLSDQLKDPLTAPFAQQALTAENWYYGRSPREAEEYFEEMIASVVNGDEPISKAMDAAAKKINNGY